MCCSNLFSIVVKDSEDKVLPKANSVVFSTETGDYCYMIRILTNSKLLDFYTTTTTSQYFSPGFRQVQIVTKTVLQLLLYI